MSNLFWGYRHINGSIKVKHLGDNPNITVAVIKDAEESPFVADIYYPKPFETLNDAYRAVHEYFGVALNDNLEILHKRIKPSFG